MKKKYLTTLLLVMLVAALSVGATLAYLTDEESNTNTFTVGKVDITLDEADVNEYGEKIPGAERVKENDYKLIPGHSYVKDPTVTVSADSEESYIRMIVTITKADELQAIFGEGFLPQDFVTGWDATIWETTNVIEEKDNTLTYEFRYHTTVSTVDADAKPLEALFTGIDFPSKVTAEQLETLEGLQVNVVAHAIQADGFENANEAWATFDNQK